MYGRVKHIIVKEPKKSIGCSRNSFGNINFSFIEKSMLFKLVIVLFYTEYSTVNELSKFI